VVGILSRRDIMAAYARSRLGGLGTARR